MTPPNFDRLARSYRWLEYLSLGPLLERTRNHHISALAACTHALVLGDGDGRFTARLLASHPTIRVHAVDASAAMLAELCRRTPRSTDNRLRTTHADARQILSSRDINLIVTHFFLDCFDQPDVDALIPRLASGLPSGTLWLVSDFRIPPGALGPPARAYIRVLYLGFRMLTGLRTIRLPDHEAPLARAGFRRIALSRRLFGMLTTELWRKE